MQVIQPTAGVLDIDQGTIALTVVSLVNINSCDLLPHTQLQTERRSAMTDAGNSGTPDDENEPIPTMQKLLDNPFLLLFLGVVVPTVFYLIWGIMEIISIPIAK